MKAQRLDVEVCDYSGYHSHKIQSLWFIREKAAMLKAAMLKAGGSYAEGEPLRRHAGIKQVVNPKGRRQK